jgi:protoporphyrinogen IX oxidase
MNTYLLIKSLHVIFVITWFAGLFYIVRLFVYQAEAKKKSENERLVLEPQYRLMAKRLWYGITWPSMILTLIFGPWMLGLRPSLLELPYMQIKLSFVGGLLIYHIICHRFFLKLQQGVDTNKGTFYRVWNEIATLFLVAIIFLIIMKNEFNWIWGTLGFVVFGIVLMISIRLYKRLRDRK